MPTPTPAAPSAPIAPTPGPWRYSPDTDTRGLYTWRIDSATRSLIASLTYGGPHDRANGEPDARLIAAAPELRDALAALCAWGDEREERLYPGAYKPWTVARALLARLGGTL
jgi:hypothetical protein